MDGQRTPIITLYLARALRGFGDGFAIIILPAYMTALGYDAARVGLVATASLLGTAVLTLAVGLDLATARHPRADAVRRRADRGHRPCLSQCRAIRPDRDCRLHRHHQSVRRRSRRAGAAGARHAGARCCEQRPHPHLCALQPDRRAVDGGGIAGLIAAGRAGAIRHLEPRRVPADVLCLCRARPRSAG